MPFQISFHSVLTGKKKSHKILTIKTWMVVQLFRIPRRQRAAHHYL